VGCWQQFYQPSFRLLPFIRYHTKQPQPVQVESGTMTNQLPLWVLYLQALSTPAIALLASVIGFFQWRTAHQRAVLDLFEKRCRPMTR
jgi:hypothetical protein